MNQWLRVEFLKADFERIFSGFLDCHHPDYHSMFSEKVNASGWTGDISEWFGYEDLVMLYSSNPNWARLEYWLYGKLLINIRDLKPWKELSAKELRANDGDCLLRFTDHPGDFRRFLTDYALRLTHPRLGDLLFGNRTALYLIRSTLISLPSAADNPGGVASKVNMAVGPVIVKPKKKGGFRANHKTVRKKKSGDLPDTIAASPADLCMNCFEINMRSVEGFIQTTQQISNLERNKHGLVFTVTGNAPSIIFRAMKEKIPWVALHLDLSLPSETRVKLYFRSSSDAEFSEDNSHQVLAGPGRHICRMALPCRDGIEVIRIDPGEIPGNYVLHRVIAEV